MLEFFLVLTYVSTLWKLADVWADRSGFLQLKK